MESLLGNLMPLIVRRHISATDATSSARTVSVPLRSAERQGTGQSRGRSAKRSSLRKVKTRTRGGSNFLSPLTWFCLPCYSKVQGNRYDTFEPLSGRAAWGTLDQPIPEDMRTLSLLFRRRRAFGVAELRRQYAEARLFGRHRDELPGA